NEGDRLLGVIVDTKLTGRSALSDAAGVAPSGPQALTSIAVLPFVFLSEVEEHKALSLGFADALITMLGNLAAVAVTPTSATQKITSSEKHDFKLENVFDIQDEIGRRVVESLQSRFSLAAPKARDRYSPDPEAYGEFMAGLRESTSDRRETMESAIGHLSNAV